MTKFLRRLLDRQAHHFEPGGKLEKLYPLWEAQDTILYTPGTVTAGPSHVRDGLDLKRLMMTVVFSLAGCVFMALYNTGYQANLVILRGAPPLATWQTRVVEALGFGFGPDDVVACVLHGALYFVPVFVVTFAVGGFWEVLFAVVRKHDVNEGFLVTGMLFPLILPPTVPLWQVALGVSFGVVVGKEIFGGTGMNVLNPALVGRAFIFFAYPAQLSGDTVWIAAETAADGISGATALAQATLGGTANVIADVGWMEAFVGFVPGSMGETSALACLLGAVVLVVSGGRVLANHGQCHGRHLGYGVDPEHAGLCDQPVLRYFLPRGTSYSVGGHSARSIWRPIPSPRRLRSVVITCTVFSSGSWSS